MKGPAVIYHDVELYSNRYHIKKWGSSKFNTTAALKEEEWVSDGCNKQVQSLNRIE